MNRFQAFLIVLLLWAAIYLPGLGSSELKGEEGRRILPALTMLQTGDFLVPYVGGKPYLRKPPLVSWAIAGLYRLTGARNEWMARLPSVLCVLAAAGALVGLAGREGWLSVEAGLTAALLFLTQLATVEKGRLAEIEGVYFSLSGLAIVCWLAWWAQGRTPWLWWIVPHLFLGLGLLAKGPLHLLFFYAIVVAVLWRAGELRRLFHPAHFIGLALMAGIFLAWEIPYKHTEAGTAAASVWWEQFFGRLRHFDFAAWLVNFPRALSNHLPWILFAPLLWRRDFVALGPREHALYRGARLAVVVTFFGILLLPGMLPRYTLPLLAPFSVLLAYALADERVLPSSTALRAWWRTNTGLAALLAFAAFASPAVHAWSRRAALADRARFPGGIAANFELVLLAAVGALFLSLFVVVGRHKLARPALLCSGSAALLGAGLLLYASVGIPLLRTHDRLRPLARKIDAAIPSGYNLVIYDPDYEPVIFYLETPYRYALSADEVPPQTPWILAREENRERLRERLPAYVVDTEFAKPANLLLLRLDPLPPPVRPERPKDPLGDLIIASPVPAATPAATPAPKF